MSKMNTFLMITLSAPILFSSCLLTKTSGSIKRDIDTNLPYYEKMSPYIQIPFMGDYWIHPFKDKYFMDLDKGFIKYVTKNVAHHKPQLMYTGHTIVPPYYSTIALFYKNTTPNDTFIENIRENLKEEFQTTVTDSTLVSTNFGTARSIQYTRVNPNTKIATCYREFYINNEGNLIRICFWTTDCDETIIKQETEGLIRKIKLTKP